MVDNTSHSNNAMQEVMKMLQNEDWSNAAVLCKTLCNNYPTYAEAHMMQGIINERIGNLGGAIECFEQAVRIKPDWTDAHKNLAHTCLRAGRLDTCEKSLRYVLSKVPDDKHAALGLADVLKQQNRLEESITAYQYALSLGQEHPEIHNNLAAIYTQLGRYLNAEASYKNAIRTSNDWAAPYANLSSIYIHMGKPTEALEYALKAFKLDSSYPAIREIFTLALRNAPHESIDESLLETLGARFSEENMNYQLLSRPLLAGLSRLEPFRNLLELAESATDEELQAHIASGNLSSSLAYPVFIDVLIQSVIADEVWERLLTRLRRTCLNIITAEISCIPGADTEFASHFFCALAIQCFNNDFIYNFSQDESDEVDRLIRDIDSALSDGRSVACMDKLAVAGMYRPVLSIPNSEILLSLDIGVMDKPARIFIQRQVEEPAREMAIREKIPLIGEISDDTSCRVRNQYEHSPYPRWLNVGHYTPQPVGVYMQSHFPGFRPNQIFDGPIDILIAGCGTGRHAISIATRFSHANLLAIDLSRASIAYAWRKCEELGVSNINFVQADILELDRLEQKFHMIIASGVIHHMSNPVAGLKSLDECLLDGGVIGLGLYSRIARRPITLARELISHYGIDDTPDGIRQTRRVIFSLPDDDLIKTITRSDDFYSMSNCRDLLFHTQETFYTLPEISAILNEQDLRFIGFELPDTRIGNEYRLAYPNDQDMLNLQNWHQFETQHPFTFGTMYQFYCQKQL